MWLMRQNQPDACDWRLACVQVNKDPLAVLERVRLAMKAKWLLGLVTGLACLPLPDYRLGNRFFAGEQPNTARCFARRNQTTFTVRMATIGTRVWHRQGVG